MKKIDKKTASAIVPLADRVLIREFNKESEETKTKSGIIIPVTVNSDKGAKRGEVVAVGVGRYEDGKLIPMSVKKGDTVLFSWGDKVKIDGDDFYILRETEIIAIIK
ncbi:MAG: co-chaperone GroES [bacterium]|nr:co-chaperone GroES [bacterium]